MSLVSNISLAISATLSKVLDHGTNQFPGSLKSELVMASGVAANQADLIFSDKRTLAGSANEELDLSGALVDVFGDAVVFVKVKCIMVISAAANGGDIEVGGSGANGFDSWVGAAGDLVKVKPGGAFALFAPDLAGYAVTASTGDLLRIANADASSADYDIVMIGTSA